MSDVRRLSLNVYRYMLNVNYRHTQKLYIVKYLLGKDKVSTI